MPSRSIVRRGTSAFYGCRRPDTPPRPHLEPARSPSPTPMPRRRCPVACSLARPPEGRLPRRHSGSRFDLPDGPPAAQRGTTDLRSRPARHLCNRVDPRPSSLAREVGRSGGQSGTSSARPDGRGGSSSPPPARRSAASRRIGAAMRSGVATVRRRRSVRRAATSRSAPRVFSPARSPAAPPARGGFGSRQGTALAAPARPGALAAPPCARARRRSAPCLRPTAIGRRFAWA